MRAIMTREALARPPSHERKVTMTPQPTTARLIVAGIIAGIIAGIVMAMYAMLASATVLAQGFFTPLYGIASPIVGQSAMQTSMHEGVYFTLGPALLGLMIHMMFSAVFGIIFGLAARALRLRGGLAVLAGMVYGVIVLLVMSFIVLPIVGAGTLPATVGWPSFTVEHLMYGVVLGLWPVLRPADFAATTDTHHHPLARAA